VLSSNCLSPADAPSAEIPVAAWELGGEPLCGRSATKILISEYFRDFLLEKLEVDRCLKNAVEYFIISLENGDKDYEEI
jgi:hypothetical protein